MRMNPIGLLLCICNALLFSAFCFAQEAALTAEKKVLYHCWVPTVPASFDQPELNFEFTEKEVKVQLKSAWTSEDLSTEKILSQKSRRMNRLGKVFPLEGSVIEERVRTPNFSYVLMIPATDDGVYFKDEQGENEPTSFEDEVKPTDLLAPGSVSFKLPSADEAEGFIIETWSLLCRVPKVYRDEVFEILKKEDTKSVSPMEIYELLRGLFSTASQLKAPESP